MLVTKRNLHADVVMPNHTYYHFHQEETGKAGKRKEWDKV